MFSGWQSLTFWEEEKIHKMQDMLDFLDKEEFIVNVSDTSTGRPASISFRSDGSFNDEKGGYTMAPSPFAVDTVYAELYKQSLIAIKRISSRSDIPLIRMLVVRMYGITFLDDVDIEFSLAHYY